MNERQKKFCEAFLTSGNATQSYIEAGYSPKGAGQSADKLLKNTEIQNYIQEQLRTLHNSKIASAEEVLEYFTKVMRGESQSEVIVYETKNGITKPIHMKKAPDEKERLRAGENLGKRYRLFTDRMDINVETPVFTGEDELED